MKELGKLSLAVDLVRVLRRAPQLLSAFSFCLVAIATPGLAENLEDFSKAAGSKGGVDMIPFEGLRKEAGALANEVDERKKSATGFNYSAYEDQKNSRLGKQANKRKEIEDKKNEVEALKKLERQDGVPGKEKELKDLEQELTDIDKELKALDDKLAEGADAWKRFWNARGGLREKFDDALTKVKDAKSNPKQYLSSEASDQDIEKLKRYCDIIEDEIKSQEATHKQQEEGAQKTEQRFLELIKKTN